MQTGEQTTTEPVTREARAEWFLEQLEQAPIQAEALKTFIDRQYEASRRVEGDELAEFLEGALVDAGRFAEAVDILYLSARRCADPAVSVSQFRSIAERLLKADRERLVFVENTFVEGLDAVECVRRLLLLLSLDSGVLCLDKTWGFGVVDAVDHFYKKVRIDFRGKPGHEMSFGYAAETLDLIADDHLLARQHHAPEEMAELVASNPGDVVVMALASFGPLPVVRLQEILVPHFVDDGRWKTFWDSARKSLKANPLVEFPAKRSEAIVLHAEVQQQDAAWFERLRAERGLKKLVGQIEQLFEETSPDAWPENATDVLSDRLAFALKGAEGRHPDLLARALMISEASDLPRAHEEAAFYLRKALHPAALLGAAEDLTVRHFRAYLVYLLERHSDDSAGLLLAQLSYLPLAPLTDVVDALVQHDQENACRDALSQIMDERPVGVHILNWAARNLDRVEAWKLVAPVVLANEMLTSLELMEGGNRSKERSQLLAQFENRTWLKGVLSAMNEDQRRTYLHRVKDSTAFPTVDQRSVLAAMIKLYPELEAELAARPPKVEARQAGKFSSYRSYESRRKQLEKIVSVDIPSNSKEIAVARSYGDLRENHEYKAAKEMQGLLMRRQAELERMLTIVKATDFEGFPSDRVGMGTGVKLRYEDGRTESYFILGEWDRDEELGIISCQSGMARAVENAFSGDELSVPSETGNVTCTVEEVTGLSEAVREWINATSDDE